MSIENFCMNVCNNQLFQQTGLQLLFCSRTLAEREVTQAASMLPSAGYVCLIINALDCFSSLPCIYLIVISFLKIFAALYLHIGLKKHRKKLSQLFKNKHNSFFLWFFYKANFIVCSNYSKLSNFLYKKGRLRSNHSF